MDSVVNLRKKIEPKDPPSRPVIHAPEKKPAAPSPKTNTDHKNIFWEFDSNHLIDSLFIGVTIAIFIGLGLLFIFIGKNISLGLLFIVSSGAIAINIFKKPKVIEVEIDKLKILIDGKVFYLRDLRSFWIQYQPAGLKELILETKKWYMPYIHLPFSLLSPVQLRSFLIEYLPEKEYQQSVVDIFSRKIGF